MVSEQPLKFLDALRNAPAWILGGLTFAGVVLLWIPPIANIDLTLFKQQYGIWVYLDIIVFGSLFIFKLGDSVLSLLKNFYRADKKRKQVIRNLNTLSSQERNTISFYLDKNIRSYSGSVTDPIFEMLYSKGLLEVFLDASDPLNAPIIIPEYVWNELQKRKNEFPPFNPSLT